LFFKFTEYKSLPTREGKDNYGYRGSQGRNYTIHTKITTKMFSYRCTSETYIFKHSPSEPYFMTLTDEITGNSNNSSLTKSDNGKPNIQK
jgi:hypothetical protein